MIRVKTDISLDVSKALAQLHLEKLHTGLLSSYINKVILKNLLNNFFFSPLPPSAYIRVVLIMISCIVF